MVNVPIESTARRPAGTVNGAGVSAVGFGVDVPAAREMTRRAGQEFTL